MNNGADLLLLYAVSMCHGSWSFFILIIAYFRINHNAHAQVLDLILIDANKLVFVYKADI